MGTPTGHKADLSVWKPEHLQNYLLISELATMVGRTRARILQLEADGRIPKPIRVKHGRLMVRLYSPDDARQIAEIIANAKSGQASPHYGEAARYG